MAFFILGSGTAVGLKNVHDDRKLSRRMQEKRAQRLQEMEMSEEEFLALVERRRERKASYSRDDASQRSRKRRARTGMDEDPLREQKTSRVRSDVSQLSLKQRARTHMEDEQLREHQSTHTVRAERNRSRSRRR